MAEKFNFPAIHFPFSSNQCYAMAPHLPPLHLPNECIMLKFTTMTGLSLARLPADVLFVSTVHMEAISHAAAPGATRLHSRSRYRGRRRPC